jgi:hypothetical protein
MCAADFHYWLITVKLSRLIIFFWRYGSFFNKLRILP